MRIALGLIVGATLLVATLHGQTATTASVDVRAIGPRVGERVPEFSLRDQHGQLRTLASVMGPKGLVLVFFRSADW